MFTFPVTMMSSVGGGDDYDPLATWGEFDGTDYVDLGTQAVLDPTTRTVSVWFKRADTSQDVFLGMGAFSQRWLFGFTGNTLQSKHNYGDYRYYGSVGTAISTGDWHHAVVIETKLSTPQFFLDGVEYSAVLSLSRGSDGWPSLGAFTIGKTLGYGDGSYTGEMSDIRMYDRALSVDEITYLYNRGTSGTNPGTSNLVGHWKFDEGSGTTVGDSSGNGNDGTATNINEATFWNP